VLHPDDSGPECEDRTVDECAAQGGTVVAGATSCLPKPCDGASCTPDPCGGTAGGGDDHGDNSGSSGSGGSSGRGGADDPSGHD
jgi:hypothetical protein